MTEGSEPRGPTPDEVRPHPPSSLPTTGFSRGVDGVIDAIGRASAWLWLALMAVIVANVVLRYLLGEGRIELEELQWHLYSLGFLLALSWALVTDDHIRVDVVHERLAPRTRAWIELYGTLLLLLPFLLLVLRYALPFAWQAWSVGEVSQAPGGLPARWLIKAALPLGFLLLLLAALARLSRVCALLFGPPVDDRTPP